MKYDKIMRAEEVPVRICWVQSERLQTFNWIVFVAAYIRSTMGTCNLAMRLMDLFVERTCEPIPNLQLLACACLLVASSLNESVPATASELAYQTRDSVREDEIRDKALEVSQRLNFNLWRSYPLFFIDCDERDDVYEFARFICLCVYATNTLAQRRTCSEIADAALCLSRLSFGLKANISEMDYLMKIQTRVEEIQENGKLMDGIFEYFCDKKRHRVATRKIVSAETLHSSINLK